ncbi:MAG TPA: hypothetical protein VGM86_31760 [Thermoanaerobaculia bacterium]|jgi:hypothetical protein
MESELELKKARDFHEAEILRLRQVADDALKEAEKHAGRVQAYDVVLSDLPSVRANFAEQLTLGIDDGQEEAGEDYEEEESSGLDLLDGPGTSLVEYVRSALSRLAKGSTFSGSDIRDDVETRAPGFLSTLESKALAKVLWGLANAGEIERVQGGHGRRPAVYRVPKGGKP